MILHQKDVALIALKEFEYRVENPEKIIKTGFPKLDEKLINITNKIIVIAARPGVGKTAFAMQIANNIANDGYSVGIISLEMSETELVFRTIANKLKIPLSAIQKGDAKYRDSVIKGFVDISNTDIYYAFAGHTINALQQVIDKLIERNIKALILDHLQLTFTKDGSRNQQIEMILKLFLMIRKKYKLPIIILSQLNRAMERERREPTLADLRDSGSIEQDADIVIFLHDKGIDEDSGGKILNLIIAKNRSGGMGRLEYLFITKYMFFEEK